MRKILCVGNPFAYPDNFGMEVYKELLTMNLEDIEVIEGGVGGLSLTPHFESSDPILIVDFGVGFEKNILTLDDINAIQIDTFSHSNAFIYLLKSLEKDNILLYISNNDNWNENEISIYCQEILEVVRGM